MENSICCFQKLILLAATPTLFRIMRWWNFCKYFNPRAETRIEPIIGEEIHLKGPHSVIAGTLIYPNGAFGGVIGSILPIIENRSEFVDKLFGDPIWDWGPLGKGLPKDQQILSFLYEYVFPFKWLWILRPVITVADMVFSLVPIYGFYQTLGFSGFSPFVLYKE